MTPEEKAREQIDQLLRYAGWDIQDRKEMNLFNPNRPGVAVREAQSACYAVGLPDTR